MRHVPEWMLNGVQYRAKCLFSRVRLLNTGITIIGIKSCPDVVSDVNPVFVCNATQRSYLETQMYSGRA